MTHPIPEGFATITPSIALKNCAGMIETYKNAFDAKELDRTMCPVTGKVMYATLQIGTSKIMVSDEFPNCPPAKGSSFYLYVPKRRDGFAVSERSAEEIKKLAEKHVQVGLKITPGEF